MAEEHLLSVDVGTTSTKIGLFVTDGKLKQLSTKEYTLKTPASNIAELPVDTYWKSLCEGIREVLEKSKVNCKSVIALSFSSQAETLICVNKKRAGFKRCYCLAGYKGRGGGKGNSRKLLF